MKPLNGKTVFITGGTKGIGRATAELLANNGAIIYIVGRQKKEMNDVLNAVKYFNPLSSGIIGDITKYDDVEKAFEDFDRNIGNLDILINNAGIGARSITSSGFDMIDKVLRTNINGHLICSKMAIERMIKNGGGHIINIGSLGAYIYDENADLYVTTKSAIRGFTYSLRKTVDRYNIKLTLIEPGNVGSEMISESIQDKKLLIESGHLLSTEDIASSILYAINQPPRCEIMNIQLKPQKQHL